MSTQSNAIALFNTFKAEFDRRQDELASLLPPHIELKQFVACAVVAVKRNPDLLLCNRRSLHNAITDSAYDQIMPDGREGVLIPRKEKVKKGDQETWIQVACWQPMVRGIRKRAAELAELIIDGKVVCKNDQFEWEEGLTPILRHVPTPLDKDPGPMIGAYAIFRRNGHVLHFEVMRKGQILAVKAISKQPGGLMWGKFEDQAWIKTVVRRASKSVPAVPYRLQQIIERHDDDFSVDQDQRPLIEHDDVRDDNPLADAEGTPPPDAEASQDVNLDAAPQITNGSGEAMEPLASRPMPERVAKMRERRA